MVYFQWFLSRIAALANGHSNQLHDMKQIPTTIFPVCLVWIKYQQQFSEVARRESNPKNNFPSLHGVNQMTTIIFPACTAWIKYQWLLTKCLQREFNIYTTIWPESPIIVVKRYIAIYIARLWWKHVAHFNWKYFIYWKIIVSLL